MRCLLSSLILGFSAAAAAAAQAFVFSWLPARQNSTAADLTQGVRNTDVRTCVRISFFRLAVIRTCVVAF